MATSKCYYPRPSHRFFSGDQNITAGPEFELDEWDLFNQGPTGAEPVGFSFGNLTTITGTVGDDRKRSVRLASDDLSRAAPSSRPVNVPDWSKILRAENRGSRRWCEDVGPENDGDGESGGEGGGGRREPPHEVLARRRMASFSVHEGAGRTLKGRDLSRVRNAIFEITGFQD